MQPGMEPGSHSQGAIAKNFFNGTIGAFIQLVRVKPLGNI
ncbi:hypothetical protein PC116_g6035 [Phytophthora cactorum]|nr:hypothetical protein PC128_g2779 [Phytophthora cactorum]KAG4246210.1 hypothetical protein PC116_g6035 [Phytophthora cactorum]